MTEADAARVCVEMEAGDQVRIGDALMTLKHKSGRYARMVFMMPDGVEVEIIRQQKSQRTPPPRR